MFNIYYVKELPLLNNLIQTIIFGSLTYDTAVKLKNWRVGINYRAQKVVQDLCILASTSSSGSDDTPTVYQSGPSFPQPAPQLDPRFPQPSLRFPPVIPVVPETTGFQGPFIPPQAFPQPPAFPQPQAFPQPITVTTLPPRVPTFLSERPVDAYEFVEKHGQLIVGGLRLALLEDAAGCH
jgi:hypothetical protein